MPNAKPWYRSKTLIFNAAGGAAAALPLLEGALPQLMQVLPADYYALLTAALALGNALLRLVTKGPLMASQAR